MIDRWMRVWIGLAVVSAALEHLKLRLEEIGIDDPIVENDITGAIDVLRTLNVETSRGERT